MDHEDALARLRAADPAQGAEVDVARLRTAVDARIAAEAGGEGLAPVTDIRASRSRRWLRVASAAAAAVVVGGVGFGLGNGALLGRTGGGDTAFDGAATSEAASGLAPADAAAPEAGGGGVDSAAAMDERMIWPGWPERQTFTPVGLPNEAGTATMWAFDATAAWTEARVAEIAAVLGVEGTPELTDGSWVVGTLDGTGPYLMVYPDGQAGLNFYDPAADPWNCEAVREGAAECPDLGPAPTDDEARQLTRDLLAELGLDPAAFEYEVSKDEGAGWISVAAYQLLDGRRTGVSWWASYSGGGLQSLSGSLAALVDLGTYPVVGAEEAVSRITDPRFGTIGGFSVLPAARGGGVLEGDAMVEDQVVAPDTTPTEPPAPLAPGAAVPWPVEDVEITGAELGLAQWTTADGVSLLVPAWELSADDGRTWTVLALAEDALDMTSVED